MNLVWRTPQCTPEGEAPSPIHGMEQTIEQTKGGTR